VLKVIFSSCLYAFYVNNVSVVDWTRVFTSTVSRLCVDMAD
jgi:hypothetical protein